MQRQSWGPFALAVAIAAGVVIGGLMLAVALWVLGALAGLFFGLLRIASLVAVAALVVWAVRTVLRERHPA